MPEAKHQHQVIVQSCCETTKVALDLSDEEWAFVQRLAAATAAASTDAHHPTLEVVA